VNGDPNPNRPDLPQYGAGETAHKPLMAALPTQSSMRLEFGCAEFPSAMRACWLR
jgi:hypothetical protein